MRQLVALLALWLPLAAVAAEPQPLWEVGGSLTLLTYPDYRGATHYNLAPLPLPYFVYRGNKVRVTREGARARLLQSDRLHLDLSAAASLASNTNEESSARAGMPKLLPTFEIGPSLDYWLTPQQRDRWNWRLRLPVRAVAGFDFSHSRRVGWLAHPHVQADYLTNAGAWDLVWIGSLGTLWADRSYHAYFYQVDPQYATPQRPAYEARAGYSGTRATLFFSAGRGRWRFGAGVIEDWLDGAAFRDSPLVRTSNATVFGAFLTYRVWASEEQVGGEVTPP